MTQISFLFPLSRPETSPTSTLADEQQSLRQQGSTLFFERTERWTDSNLSAPGDPAAHLQRNAPKLFTTTMSNAGQLR